ncbi:MAG: hypothetical protein AAFQ67_05685, partial [Pseudomonadota bacterium]
MKQGIYAAMTASAALTGCISAKSSHVDYAKRNLPEGMHYAAPKGLLRLELWESAGELFLAVSDPF